MAKEVFKRYEKKYKLDTFTYLNIRQELLEHMEPDAYKQKNGFYSIANIYYDTPDDQLIRTSLHKPLYKEKLRLRAYGIPKPQDQVYVEIKKKFQGLVSKRRTAMPLAEAEAFLNSGQLPKQESGVNWQVTHEIQYLEQEYPLVPKLYLSYDREAFFDRQNPNLRISFDTNIRSRRYDLQLSAGNYGTPLLDPNTWLMEIKTPTRIPFWLGQLLSELDIYPISFSKYGTEYKTWLQKQTNKGDIASCLNFSQPLEAALLLPKSALPVQL